MRISDFQKLMADLYLSRDVARGSDATFRWLVEEIGELARAIRQNDPAQIAEESADVLAWLSSLANILHIDLESAVQKKYPHMCPRCKQIPCRCEEERPNKTKIAKPL